MYIRLETEDIERKTLSKYAILSAESKGRKTFEAQDDIRTCFQRDRDRIIHSKAFRRLKHKTQVFISPEGDHYRTRLTHTLEVSQIARTIARALRLNEDLVEAISLAHDLGHTPFGHMGEKALNNLSPVGFKHYEQSIRVVEILEQRRKGRGLNLSIEVLDGIRNHSGNNKAFTLEGNVVKYADRIAYINHDIDDAIRAGILKLSDIPKKLLDILGEGHSERINAMIIDLIKHSKDKDSIQMSEEIYCATMDLRKFLFETVYYNPIIIDEDTKTKFIITELYKYYMNNFSNLPKEHIDIYTDEEKKDRSQVIIDYLASTSDNFIVGLFNKIFIPTPFRIHY